MATLHWRNGISGDWATAADWTPAATPGAADTVMIDAAGTYAVAITTAVNAKNLTINDAGATVVDTGILTLSGALTATAGVFDLAAGGVVSGGTLSATGGSFAWNGGTLDGASYQGALDLTATGASLNIANGLTMTGAGGVGGGVIDATGSGASLYFIGTQALNNTILNIGASALQFDSLTIGSNATVNVVSGVGYDYGTDLTNNGTWNATAGNFGANLFLASFLNNGQINVGNTGLFQAWATDATNAGTITVTTGGGFGLYGTNSVTNSGLIQDDAGVYISGPSFINSGLINVSALGGTLQVNGAVGTTAGTMSGAGTINLTGDASNISFVGSEAVQQGTINLSGANNVIWNSGNGAPTIGGTLTLGSQVVINQTAGSATFKDMQSGGYHDINNGVINAAAKGGIFIIQPTSFTNNGAINVSNGDILLIRAPLDGTGRVTMAGGGTAEIAGSSAAGQMFTFADANGDVLKLDSASSFASAITGFSIGDTIDLAGVSANSASLANGLLTVGLTGGGTLKLAVAGNTAGQFIHTVSDNAGGTDIVLTASAAQPLPATQPALVITPGLGAIGLDIVSDSRAGMAPAGLSQVVTSNTNSATTAAVQTPISATTSATASDPVTGSSVTVAQTITAGWTDSYNATATFSDTWIETNTYNNSTSSTYGMGSSSATFTVNLAAGGSFDMSWLALEGGASNFGMLNLALSVDGAALLYSVAGTAFSATPIGDYVGTLSAGVHTLVVEDVSNVFGSPYPGTATMSEAIKLAITANPFTGNVYTDLGAANTVVEGTTATVAVGSFADSNLADVASQFTATTTWSDGTVTTGSVSGGNGVFTVTDTNSFGAEGVFADSVSVTNSADNVTTLLSGSITVTEADSFAVASAPAITAAARQAVSGTIASFTNSYAGNSADLAATITWGDGTSSVGTIADINGTLAVSGSHAYATAGTDAVSVVLTDVDGSATATASGTATIVSDYAGSGTQLATTERSASAATVASFTDAITTDLASGFTASIAWGDGTTSAGTVTGSNGAFAVASSGHAYGAEGSYALSTTITNAADGTKLVYAGSATAAEADVLAAGAAVAVSATAGKAMSGTVANFTDTSSTSSAADFAATITWGDGTSSVGTVSYTSGAIAVAGSHTYAAAGSDAVSVVLTDVDGSAKATATTTATVAAAAPTPPGSYVLTTHQDHLAGGAGNDLFVAATNTLSTNDWIDGGAGTNTLLLSGGGAFNLAVVDQLLNMQVVSAQEGVGAAAQIVTLRENTKLAVNVASGPAGSGITINGAQNHDIITLGSGQDVVTIGVGETVIGGGGNATVYVSSDAMVDTITGGSTGSTNLVLTSAGDLALTSKMTGITAVQLTGTSHFAAGSNAGLTISGSAAGGDSITIGAASQSVVAGGAGEHILASAANAGALVSGLGAASLLEITGGGTATLAANTAVSAVKLDAATGLTLSKMSFITATGSSGADTITAGATYQTLTGGAGADTLIGFVGGYDSFTDTASGLNGDLIKGFLASDQIDITNLGFAGAALKVVASGANTLVTVTSGSMKSAFTMAGSVSASGFHLASDGNTGTLLTHI